MLGDGPRGIRAAHDDLDVDAGPILAGSLRGGDEFDLQSRMPLLQRGQRRDRVLEGEGLRTGQANRAGQGGARMRIDPTECRLDVLGDRQELTPGGVELPTVGGGHEHALAIGLLERGDASRDGRVIEAEAVGGGRELPQTSDGEQSQQILRGDLLTGSAWCI